MNSDLPPPPYPPKHPQTPHQPPLQTNLLTLSKSLTAHLVPVRPTIFPCLPSAASHLPQDFNPHQQIENDIFFLLFFILKSWEHQECVCVYVCVRSGGDRILTVCVSTHNHHYRPPNYPPPHHHLPTQSHPSQNTSPPQKERDGQMDFKQQGRSSIHPSIHHMHPSIHPEERRKMKGREEE